MFKTVLALALLLVVKVLASPLHTTTSFRDHRGIFQEPYCAWQGGMCTQVDECNPKNIVRVATLCPKQADFGIVCCYN